MPMQDEIGVGRVQCREKRGQREGVGRRQRRNRRGQLRDSGNVEARTACRFV